KRAQLENAILNEANLTSSHLNEANLTGSNLSGANLTLTNMAGADMSDVEMNGVIVTEKNWIDRLEELHVIGANEIQSRYKLVDESFKNQVKFRLEKIGG